MRIALLADIHANRQAFSACLEDVKTKGVERFLLLGDYVGYGADPIWTVNTTIQLVREGAVAVLGNHDSAIGEESSGFNVEAKIVIDWTRGLLGLEERKFLAGLPLSVADERHLFVHADASAPARWIYVLTVEEAARSLRATNAEITFCGHTHKPAIFSMTPAAKMTAFTPVTGVHVPLKGPRRWLVVVGSVGQPRDGVPAASYAIFDSDKRQITFQRVPYDIDAAAEAIREARLPQFFANRLFIGR